MVFGGLMDSALNEINEALEQLSSHGFHAMRGTKEDFCLPAIGYSCVGVSYDSALHSLFCRCDTSLKADDDDDVILALEINHGSVLSSENRLFISSLDDRTVWLGRSVAVADLQVFQIRQRLLDFVDSVVFDRRRIDDYLAGRPEGGYMPAEFAPSGQEPLIYLSV